MKPRSQFLLALFAPLALLFFPETAWPASTPRVETLENGLKVVLMEDHSAPLAVAAVWVHVGGKDESEELAGFAHYLEHLIPQGTANRVPRQQELEVFRAGGISSVQADYDRTFFFVEVEKAALNGALAGLLQQVSQASLPQGGVEWIRPGLAFELRLAYDDPLQVLFLEQMRAAFPGQPYRFPYYGSFESLGALEHSSADAFYANFYAPNNMVVAVGGDIHPGKALTRVKELFGSLKASKTLPPKPPFEGGFTGPRQVVKNLARMSPSLSLLFPAPGYRHPDRYALAVLARLLDDGRASPLMKETGDLPKLARSTSTRFHLLEERSLLALTTQLVSAGTARDTGRILISALKRIRDEGFPEADVRRVVRRMQLQAAVRRDPIGTLVQDLAEGTLFGDVRYGWELEANLGRVTASEVKRVAAVYLVGENAKTLLVLPKPEKRPPQEDLDALATVMSGLDAGTPPRNPPDFKAVLYAAERFPPLASHGDRKPPSPAVRSVLPNGLTLLLKPDRGRGLVAVSLQIRAGSAFDPVGKEGLAQMVASALSRGSRAIPARAFHERVEAVGATFGITASREAVEAGLTVFRGDVAEALTLLARPAIDPGFAEEGIPAIRDLILGFSGALAASPSDVARDLIREKLYQGHPYGRPPAGSEATLASIGREDLADFHQRYYRPDRAVLTLAGDLNAAEVKRLVGESFGGWAVPPGTPAPVDLPEAASKEAQASEYSRVLETLPAVSVLGFPGVPLQDPDFPMLRALGTVLTARGFLDLVLDQPLVLSVTTTPEGLSRGGILYVEASAAPSETSRIGYEMILRARTLGLKEVTPETIQDLLRIERGRLLREKEGIYTLASNLGYYELLGAGFGVYDEGRTVPADLTPTSLREAAARYLDASRLVRVTVGPHRR